MNNEIFDKIKEIAGENASDYNKRFIESQQRIAIEIAKKWQHDNPFICDKEKDSDEYKAELDEYNRRLQEYIENWLKETPDEMLFNMRVLSQGLGQLFNLLSSINTHLMELEDVYKICNNQKLTAFVQKQMKMVKMKQEQEQKVDTQKTDK